MMPHHMGTTMSPFTYQRVLNKEAAILRDMILQGECPEIGRDFGEHHLNRLGYVRLKFYTPRHRMDGDTIVDPIYTGPLPVYDLVLGRHVHAGQCLGTRDV